MKQRQYQLLENRLFKSKVVNRREMMVCVLLRLKHIFYYKFVVVGYIWNAYW